MEQRLSENEKEKRKRIVIIIAIILLLLIMSLFLIFYRKTYEITFDSNGGSEVSSIKVKDGDKVEEPDKPVKEGYIFAGWYYLNELYDFDTPVRSDMTLEAEWKEQENAEVEGISLDITELNMAPDRTAVLVATILPENANNVKLIWTSSDESIATVDENGNIKALKEGTITITVSTEDGKYTASCTVTVKPVEEVENETKSEENANNNSKSNKTNAPSTSNKQSAPSTSSTPSNSSTPSTPSNPSNPSTPNQPSNPQKESTYVLHLTAIPVEGVQGAVYQYKFRISKDGNSFTSYSGFEINGNKYRNTSSNSTVSGNHVSPGGNTATITLSSGEVKTLIVRFN